MRTSILTFLLIGLVSGCGPQPSRFSIINSSGTVITDVTVINGRNSTNLGSIGPGRKKSVEFSSFFETEYLLSYKRRGQPFKLDLCYQGMDFPANGVIVIKANKASIECR